MFLVTNAWKITKTSINKLEEAVLKVGEEAVLTCTADVKVDGCSFYGGKEKNGYTLSKDGGAWYKPDGIKVNSTGENECSMKILKLDHIHNGEWRCDITHCNDNNDCDAKSETIDLIVAQKPSQIYLEEANNTKVTKVTSRVQSSASIFMNLTIETQVKVKCVTKGANPQPRFKWFLHGTELTSHVEREDNGSYVSELTYEGDREHSEKTLKCEIEQEGYTEDDIKNGENVVQVEMKIVGDPPGSLEVPMGITVGVLALLGIIAGAIYIYLKKNQSKSYETASIELGSLKAEEDFEKNP